MPSRRGPDGTARISISGLNELNTWTNIFWVHLTTGSSIIQSDFDTYVADVAAAFKTAFAARQSSSVAYSLAVGTYFAPGGGVLQSDQPMSGNGTGASTFVNDLSCCKIVSWNTGVYWRGGKPRTYIAGVIQADTFDGYKLQSTEQTALQTAGNAYLAAVNALAVGTISASALGFVSFFTGGAHRATPEFFTFASCKVHPRLGSQRRRLGKWLP